MARKTYPEERKCKQCGATLSIYNPADSCFSHDFPKDHLGGDPDSSLLNSCVLGRGVVNDGNKTSTASAALALVRIDYEGR